ncbi:MAG TPA: hypothetical protein VGJ95_12545 [Pseudonocardiaceae bacterium]
MVCERGRAFQLAAGPAVGLEMPPASLDVRTATEVDRAMYVTAKEVARLGATGHCR